MPSVQGGGTYLRYTTGMDSSLQDGQHWLSHHVNGTWKAQHDFSKMFTSDDVFNALKCYEMPISSLAIERSESQDPCFQAVDVRSPFCTETSCIRD